VLLNLFNNAFYSVAEKKRKIDGQYVPTISLSTKKSGSKIEIHVKDNGTGIPQKGQGTGLGLSLAYDIITKEHGGQLRVETKEGEGAEFVIELPIK
jgi:two-component system, NtrC family, sensor kinase